MEATIKKIHQSGHTRIMALYTLGTRLSRIYSARFEQEGLLYLEASGDIERSLMHSIFDGVKAFDDAAILKTGTCLFNQLLVVQDHFDCILAGCTEVPFVVKKLRERGSPAIKQFLRRVQIIDPVAAALEFT
jgi:aspartate/glutamate racemase